MCIRKYVNIETICVFILYHASEYNLRTTFKYVCNHKSYDYKFRPLLYHRYIEKQFIKNGSSEFVSFSFNY